MITHQTPYRIVVSRADGCYVADFTDAKGAADLRALLGTAVLPLPFTLLADIATVLADVAARNPDHVVTFASRR